MNERIRKLRKALDMTQAAFAEKIGMKQNSIALIESGKRNISDYALRVICREFNVNEKWLRTGEGEMFIPAPSNALEALAAERDLTHADYILIEKFVNMKKEGRAALIEFILDAAAAITGSEASAGEPATPISDSVADAEATYEKSLGFVPSVDSSASNITEGTEKDKRREA